MTLSLACKELFQSKYNLLLFLFIYSPCNIHTWQIIYYNNNYYVKQKAEYYITLQHEIMLLEIANKLHWLYISVDE